MTSFRLTLLILIYLALLVTAAIAVFMLQIDQQIVNQFILPWLAFPLQSILVVVYFFIAFIIYRLSWPLAGQLLHSVFLQRILLSSSNYLVNEIHRADNNDRAYIIAPRQTLQYLVSSMINVIAFSVAGFFSLTMFFSRETVAVVTGLITAGFGFGARTMIGDLLAGAGNIFEDNFDVGDKVEIIQSVNRIEGVIESLTLRTITVRAPTGELFVVPHGEARILRNFSRGAHSSTFVQIKVATADLPQTLKLLETINKASVELLPNLLAPWLLVNEEGKLGHQTQLTLVCHAKFGQGATLRLNLLALLHERLSQAGIELAD